jgi:hypothetical protein
MNEDPFKWGVACADLLLRPNSRHCEDFTTGLAVAPIAWATKRQVAQLVAATTSPMMGGTGNSVIYLTLRAELCLCRQREWGLCGTPQAWDGVEVNSSPHQIGCRLC